MLKNVKHDLRSLVGAHKSLYPLFGLKKSNRDLMISGDTDIVIDGYPRSANTFSVVAFQQSQMNACRVAHHLHIPAQILIAVDRDIPTILLVRNPRDAIMSLLIRHPELDLRRCIDDYIVFYRTAYPVRAEVVVADFEMVTKDLGSVISEVNRKYGTGFGKFEASPGNLQKVFSAIEEIRKNNNRSANQIAIPNTAKEREKEKMQHIMDNASVASKLAMAMSLYQEYLDRTSYAS